MKCLSIDIETTGLDESFCQILEFSAVAFDTEKIVDLVHLPHLTLRFYYDRIVGESFALAMNAALISDMPLRRGLYPYVNIDTLYSHLVEFKQQHYGCFEKVTLTGKNYAMFDNRFLSKVPRWTLEGNFHRRVLDPAQYYFDRANDLCLPDTALCIKRANIEWDSKLLHSALWDARLVVQLIWHGLSMNNLR